MYVYRVHQVIIRQLMLHHVVFAQVESILQRDPMHVQRVLEELIPTQVLIIAQFVQQVIILMMDRHLVCFVKQVNTL